MLRQVIKFIVQSLKFMAGKRKTFFFCLLSGILLAVPFNNGNLWLFSWFGFLPLFIALENKSKTKAFLLSFITGVIFWSATIYWLVHVTLTGTILLVLYLSLYFGIFGFFFVYFYKRFSNLVFPLIIACLWVFLEYARSYLLTGFPWALLGYSQYLNLPVIQISDITGAWGVSFLVMIINVLIKEVAPRQPRTKKVFFLPVAILVLSLGYGYYNISRFPQDAGRRPLKISVIQGNIPQELKWNPASRSYIVDKYLKISSQAVKDRPDLIIWPEASLPVVLEEEPTFFAPVKDFAAETKTPLLLGAVTSRNELYYNSALLVSGGGEVVAQYDKLHLVPFGEYIPLRKTLSFLETIAPIGDIEKGKDYTIFTQPAKFSVLICFEDLFPQISREFIKRGAGFLVNVTNDAWYKQTQAPFQHFQASVFRAVENRAYLVRSANTGVSGFISPAGKIISLVHDRSGRNIFVGGFDTQEIAVSGGTLSLYTRYGDIFPLVCFLSVLCGIIFNPFPSAPCGLQHQLLPGFRF